MNIILDFLEKNWQRLQLGHFGDPLNWACILKTPRFQASSHIIFFVLSEASSEPILVVKIPRVSGDNCRLEREVKNLRAVQAAREGGFDSIPKVIAYEDWKNNRLLVQNALTGRIMRPTLVRRQEKLCIDAVFSWLVELNVVTYSSHRDKYDCFVQAVKKSLDDLESAFSQTSDGKKLIQQTRDLVAPLQGKNIPSVFEHGDLSSPNIIIRSNHKSSVVDWELAEPRGLPAVDLFFFLTYVAFARQKARRYQDYLGAFQTTFFGKNAWARPYITHYSEKLKLSHEVLNPLFILCWCRYVGNLINRLTNFGLLTLDDATCAWLQSNRYYALWKYTLENSDKLNLTR